MKERERAERAEMWSEKIFKKIQTRSEECWSRRHVWQGFRLGAEGAGMGQMGRDEAEQGRYIYNMTRRLTSWTTHPGHLLTSHTHTPIT